ncbi:23S rRNA (uracil(1939)-C(5))-methyltransferase RlmD [Egbenema bharatensis]|uniref:23S rRNA (uracil(1939)-C(5))-methyltransferase RlmD n=1 Tax=Egbenema bharatensis TaxID=3463334 RepID=UPI003A8A9116
MTESETQNPKFKTPNSESEAIWQQGALLELEISDLNHNGEGVGRSNGRVVFVPDTAPGDRLLVRLIRVKPQYAHGKIHELLQASPHRIRPGCIVADKCGGCQWQHIDYDYQKTVKQNLIIQDLERIGGFSHPPVNPLLPLPTPHSPLPTPHSPLLTPHSSLLTPHSPHSPHLHYRNKATYPLSRSTTTGQVQAGYYQKGSHQLINLNQCPIQDERLNPLLAEIKQEIQQRGWSIYNEAKHQGKLRHLGLRIGRRSGEMLLTLVSKESSLEGLDEQAEVWLERYPTLVGVCLNLNPDRTNAIFGRETHCIAGQPYLHEEFAGLTFQIQPTTFFQVNTEQAESLLRFIQTELSLQGHEVLVDAYCGVGTLTLPLAKQVKRTIGMEIQPEAIEQAKVNAALNQINNVDFQAGSVEQLLPSLSVTPDVVLLDPPRKGCDRSVINALHAIQPHRIVYVSCNPATLARDLKLLGNTYTLTVVQPADFFPQTAHVECAAFLTRQASESI